MPATTPVAPRFAVRRSLLALVAACGLATMAAAQPANRAFTYQGQLAQAGLPLDATVDLQFALFDAEVGGNAVGTNQLVSGVVIIGGQFIVQLNDAGQFGAAAFDGNRRWLQISVRNPTGAGAFEVLAPRQPLTAAPYAAFSLDASNLAGQTPSFYTSLSNATGTLADARLSTNIARLNVSQTFVGPNVFSSIGNIFTGNGAGLTNLNATNILAGLLGDARLSPNIPRLNANQSYTGANTFANPSNQFVGSGASLTNLNAGAIATGTLADARLSTNVATLAGTQTFAGTNTFSNVLNSFTGSGAGLTGLNAANLASGTVADLRLSTNVATLAATQVFTGTKTFSGPVTLSNTASVLAGSGAMVTAINAANITSGTLPAARLPASGNWDLTGAFTIDASALSITAGRVGIGLATADRPFHVAGDMRVGPTAGMHVDIRPGFIENLAGTGANDDLTINSGPNAEVWIAPNGTTHVKLLNIHGADVAEKFPVTGEKPEPGMVVMIDPDSHGKLMLASGAYNHHVAGIVSGANGLPAGTILGNLPGNEDAPAIALTGRVWCWCDASTGPISAGDMLTTSDTPGHAMKCEDRSRAFGSGVGKAMTDLKEGRGMVLVLVNLQ
ncbi:MAG: hypothetical protein NTV94_19545 [Planctomycetota bacterium]|nr:hypothetical protein [Planctomycetota bacterium]